MAELDELYQEVILDHNRSPRNYRTIADANRKAQGYNPLCGDQIIVYLKLENGVIKDISFQGSGCAISKASASMMTAELKGKSETEAKKLFENVHKMLTGESNENERYGTREVGKLVILSGVSKFPARVKCATLAWHTVQSALKGGEQVASTE
jgi:nitrogen fixation protein NifU and related proteins